MAIDIKIIEPGRFDHKILYIHEDDVEQFIKKDYSDMKDKLYNVLTGKL